MRTTVAWRRSYLVKVSDDPTTEKGAQVVREMRTKVANFAKLNAKESKEKKGNA
jgi:hypothetical protein